MTPASAFERYRAVLQTLTGDSLDELDTVVSPQVVFCDPLNKVEGANKMKAAFAHLFDAATDVHYVIDDVAYGEHGAYFRWNLTATLSGKPWSVDGVTHVVFDGAGLVTHHTEYWDAASQLFARFPVIGPLLRFARRRLAIS